LTKFPHSDTTDDRLSEASQNGDDATAQEPVQHLIRQGTMSAWRGCVVNDCFEQNVPEPQVTLCVRIERETTTGTVQVEWTDVSAMHGICNADHCADLKAESEKVHDADYKPQLFTRGLLVPGAHERVCVFASPEKMASYVQEVGSGAMIDQGS
jgi:hypothetical protein